MQPNQNVLKNQTSPAASTSRPVNVNAISLKDLDLDKELAEQYASAKNLFNEIQYDEATPTNQKASVLNTITTILRAIVTMQQELHNVERVKLIETTLIDVLKRHEALRDVFLADYEQALKAKV